MRRFAELFYAESLLERVTNPNAEREFTWVAAERKMDGRAIEVGLHEGWDWRELPLVDPAKGGATRAELDALRLTAIIRATGTTRPATSGCSARKDRAVTIRSRRAGHPC